VNAGEELPLVRADLELAKDILVQLVDNANLYSKKEHPINITADETGDMVYGERGGPRPGIDPFEQGLIFDKFYRGKDQRYQGARHRDGIADRKGYRDGAWRPRFR